MVLITVTAKPVIKCDSYHREGNTYTFLASDQSALQITLLSSSVLKIAFSPTGLFERKNKSFAVIQEKLEEMEAIAVNAQATSYELTTADIRIRIQRNPMAVKIYDKYQKLLFSDAIEQPRIVEGSAITECKLLRRDEHFFGLGEKSGGLDRRGHTYKMWNSDKPCYSVTEDPLYKSIPFFMSNYHYGIFLDNTYKTRFDFGVKSDSYYTFTTPKGAMVYYFMYGKDYKQIIAQYIALTGKPIMPPKWALGFAQCRGLLTSEKLTMEIAEGYRKRKIPCDIIYQDIGWTQNLQDFKWRKGNYTDPVRMLKQLRADGFKVVVSQDPVVSQANKPQWEEADRLGYFVTDSTTSKSYDMPWPWGGNCGVVDFTNPAVANWWGKLQQQPIDDGIAGFWTDMGEPAWSNEEETERLVMRHHLGMHDEMHNVFGLTWDKVVKEQFEKRNPNRRVFQMTRSAFAGLQRYSFAWTGDSGNGSDVLKGWSQFANQIPLILSSGLGGIPFITCDITGYCGDITNYEAMSELFVRWMQFGIFNPLSRLHHEGNNAVEPWLFGAPAEKIVTDAIRLKYKCMPYLYSYAYVAHRDGLPIMRPLFLEYPDDQETYTIDHQFLWGKEFLVAPVVKKNAREKRVYFPMGQWIDYEDKQTVYQGEQWYTVKAPLHKIPLFVKKGSIIPTMPVMNYVEERTDYPITFELFPANVGEVASFQLYEDDGLSLQYLKGDCLQTNITCRSTAGGYSILLAKSNNHYKQTKRMYCLRAYLAKKPHSIKTGDGVKIKRVSPKKMQVAVKEKKEQLVWCWDKDTKTCTIVFPNTQTKNAITIYK